VVGGNVSLYNETSGAAILPTPIIGVVGLLEDAGLLATQWFKGAGERIALLGPDAVSLGGSEYLWTRHGRLAGTLAALDLETERRVQAAGRAGTGAGRGGAGPRRPAGGVVRGARGGGVGSAPHDCAEGGLAVALAESCITGREPVGCDVTLPADGRPDQVLFGEGPSRGVRAVEASRQREFEALMAESAIPWRWLGTTGGDRLRLRMGGTTIVDLELNSVEHAWRNGFEHHMA